MNIEELQLHHFVFIGIILLMIVQRLAELRLSSRNEQWLFKQGGQEHAASHFIWMKMIHSLWFVSIFAELFVFNPAFHLTTFFIFLGLVFLGQFLRYSAILTLDQRWSVRIITLPGVPIVDHGIFKWIRHPNYIGVCLEIFALPMLHGAWRTALTFSILNGMILYIRIKAEEQALYSKK